MFKLVVVTLVLKRMWLVYGAFVAFVGGGERKGPQGAEGVLEFSRDNVVDTTRSLAFRTRLFSFEDIRLKRLFGPGTRTLHADSRGAPEGLEQKDRPVIAAEHGRMLSGRQARYSEGLKDVCQVKQWLVRNGKAVPREEAEHVVFGLALVDFMEDVLKEDDTVSGWDDDVLDASVVVRNPIFWAFGKALCPGL